MIGADVVSAQHRRRRHRRASNELSEDILYLMTLLAAPWLLRQGQHIRVDIILRALPPRAAWLLEWVGDMRRSRSAVSTSSGTAAHHHGELLSRLDQHQDTGDAGMVDCSRRCRSPLSCSASNSFSACIGLPTAELGVRDDAVSRLETASHRRCAHEHVLADGIAAAARRLDRAAAHRHAGRASRSSRSTSSAPVLFLGGEAGLLQVARNSVVAVINFSLTPIPLFILMGEVLFHTGLALKVIDGVERLIRQVPGRLAVVAVVAGTIFSAISGSTIATTAMLGSLMLPVMLSRGYHPVLATGPIMAIGAVDMLIPPSALTVLLGSLSGISISKLLIGGVVPGLMLSVAFVGYIVVRVQSRPALAPADADRAQDRLGALRAAAALCPAAGVRSSSS